MLSLCQTYTGPGRQPGKPLTSCKFGPLHIVGEKACRSLRGKGVQLQSRQAVGFHFFRLKPRATQPALGLHAMEPDRGSIEGH